MTELGWRKSVRSGAQECVEVASAARRVLVRDSKTGDGSPVLAFSPVEWAGFLAKVKAVSS